MGAIRKQWRSAGQLVRFNIGLEAVEDLVADLEQALLTLA
jgi:cystathionine beta-lyase